MAGVIPDAVSINAKSQQGLGMIGWMDLVEQNLGTSNPGGSNTQVQFNNNGSFGGSSNFVWNNTTNRLNINAATNPGFSFIVNGGLVAQYTTNIYLGFMDAAGAASPTTYFGIDYDIANNRGRLDALSGGVAWRNIAINTRGGDTIFGNRIIGGPDGPAIAATYSYLKGLVLVNNSLTVGQTLSLISGTATDSCVMADFILDHNSATVYADSTPIRGVMRQIAGTSAFNSLLRAGEFHTLRSAAASGGVNNGTWIFELSLANEVAGDQVSQNIGIRLDANAAQWGITGTRQDVGILVLGVDGWYHGYRYLDTDGTTVLFDVDKVGLTFTANKLVVGSPFGIGVKGIEVQDSAASSVFTIGQTGSNRMEMLWIYNPTPGNAVAQFATAGNNNNMQFLAKTVNFQPSGNGGTGIGIAGTTTTWVKLAAGTTSRSSLNITAGVAPTAPVDGDMWYDGTNVKFRVGATTKTFTLV